MNIKELKEAIANLPDDGAIAIPDQAARCFPVFGFSLAMWEDDSDPVCEEYAKEKDLEFKPNSIVLYWD